MAAKLNQYRGTLKPDQIADGINCARRNGMRLVTDAELLLANDRFPSASSLAALSIEESGKASILRRIACAATEEAKKLWREYRSHTAKNAHWLLPKLVRQGARRLQDFASLFNPESDHPHLLDQVKQIGFYTDCLGNAHWSDPADVIDKSLAQMLVATAAILASADQVSATEIDLWVAIVGPHLNGRRPDAEAALQRWYSQMQCLGLAPAGKNEMEAFIVHGISHPAGDH